MIDQVNVRPHPVIPAPAVGEDGGASPSANASTHDAGGCPDEDYTTGDEDIIDAPDPLNGSSLGPSLNPAQSRIVQAELLRLTDSVNRLHNEIEQLRRAEHRHMQASGQTARKLRWHANRNGHMPPHDSPEGDKPA